MKKLFIIIVMILRMAFCYAQDNTKAFNPDYSSQNARKIPAVTYAVIVGIDKYQNPRIKHLSYAAADAIAFKKFLMSKAGGETPAANIRMFLNDSATFGNFTTGGLTWVKLHAKAGDRVFLYFSGHGTTVSGTDAYFLLWNLADNVNEENIQAVGTEQLFALKANIIKPLHKKGVQVILIVDACRTPMEDTTALKGFNPDLDQNTAEINAGDITFLATTNGHPSIETSNNNINHGIFTYYLLNGLYGLADDDAAPNGLITLSELSNYINRKVSKYSNRQQIPKMIYSGDDDPAVAVVDSSLLAEAMRKENVQKNAQYAYAPTRNKDFKMGSNIDLSNMPEYLSFKESLKKGDLFGDKGALTWFSEIEGQTHDTDFLQNTAIDLISALSDSGQTIINAYFSNDRNFFSKISITPFFKHGITIYDDLYAIAQKYFPDTIQNKKNYLRLSYFMKGRTLAYSYNIGEQREALDYLKKAYALDSNSLFILNAINQALANVQKYEEALSNEKKVLDKYPNWPYALILEGTLYQNIKQYDKAIQFYRKTIQIDSNNTQYAWYNLGIAYGTLKKYDSAIYCYKKDIRIDSGFSSAWYGLGGVNRDLKDYKSAASCYLKAIMIDPYYTDAWGGMGAISQDLKDYNSAIYCYREAIAIDSNFIYAWTNLGGVYLNIKRYDSATYCYKKSLMIDSNYEAAWSGLGTVYLNIRDYNPAILCYKRAIAMDTGDIAAMNGFGAVYQGLNDYKSAFLYYKKSLGIDPNYQYALFNMGTAYEATLKYDSAIVYYEKAIRTDSNYTTAWGGLANVYKNLKDYGSSIRCYKKAIAITPDDTVLWVELGTIYRALNEFNNAIYCYKRAIQINPAYTFAWENIGYDYANILSYDSALKSYWIGINIPGSEKNWFGLAIYNVLKYSNAGSAVSWYDFAMAYKKYSLSKDSIVNYLHYSIQMDSSATHFDAWPELCEALKQQSFNENAIHYLEGKRSAGDQSFMLQYNLARCYYEANDYDKALDLLKSLYGNDPVEKIDRQDFLKIPEMKWKKLAK